MKVVGREDRLSLRRSQWIPRFANMATRCNTAHGITSQGHSDACEIALVARPERSGVASTA